MEVTPFYYNDVIFRITKCGVEYGQVLGIPTSDVEDKNSRYSVPEGHVTVIWRPTNQVETVLESEVTLSDRPFYTYRPFTLDPPRLTFVQRVVDGKGTQSGYIQSKNVVATVQHVGSTKVITDVMTSDLTEIQKFKVDSPIYYDRWIGVIRHRRLELTLQSSDMSSCTTYCDGFGDRFRGQTLTIKKMVLSKADWSYCSDTVKNIADNEHIRFINVLYDVNDELLNF